MTWAEKAAGVACVILEVATKPVCISFAFAASNTVPHGRFEGSYTRFILESNF